MGNMLIKYINMAKLYLLYNINRDHLVYNRRIKNILKELATELGEDNIITNESIKYILGKERLLVTDKTKELIQKYTNNDKNLILNDPEYINLHNKVYSTCTPVSKKDLDNIILSAGILADNIIRLTCNIYLDKLHSNCTKFNKDIRNIDLDYNLGYTVLPYLHLLCYLYNFGGSDEDMTLQFTIDSISNKQRIYFKLKDLKSSIRYSSYRRGNISVKFKENDTNLTNVTDGNKYIISLLRNFSYIELYTLCDVLLSNNKLDIKYYMDNIPLFKKTVTEIFKMYKHSYLNYDRSEILKMEYTDLYRAIVEICKD